MLNEMTGRDFIRTLLLSTVALGLISLYFYMRGGLSLPLFEGMLAFIAAGAIFDTFWVNARRRRMRFASERMISPAEKQETQLKSGRKLLRAVGAAVIAALTIQLLVKLWFILH